VEGKLVDGGKIRELVEEEYKKAGISRAEVDTGAVIVTGETSRRENARTVLEALSALAGDFVVTTAGPDLESVLAAKGSGAVEYSRDTGRTVLHMDIGGGTSNLALIRAGKILQTGCLNVGGRLVKFSERGEITYLSPVLSGICHWNPGEIPTGRQREELARTLAAALEMAAGRRERTPLLDQLLTEEAAKPWQVPEEEPVISFSGGVADCIRQEIPPLTYGDLGPELGRAIRESGLCRGEYILGTETIRATVIGAGCHTTQLSGSTVYYQNITFPMKNLPVLKISDVSVIREIRQEQQGIVSMEGIQSPSYRQVAELAEALVRQMPSPVLLCLEQDMAKALGQALAVRLPLEAPVLCIDRIRLEEGSFLDIGAPVGDALPVVVKTLVLSK
jgi:ethanolamine utilization protein EutA